MKTKVCTKCNKEKLESEYYSKGKPKVGLRSECKECSTKLSIKRRDKNKDGYWYVYKIIEERDKQ